MYVVRMKIYLMFRSRLHEARRKSSLGDFFLDIIVFILYEIEKKIAPPIRCIPLSGLRRQVVCPAPVRMLFSKLEIALKCICVYIHPAFISSPSELGPAGKMTSHQSEQFLWGSHVNI